MNYADALVWGLILVLIVCQTTDYKYLSSGSSNGLKGIFAVCVVLHHLAQKTSAGYFYRYFGNIGIFLVAGFFLLSGIGLAYSICHGDDKKKYLKRILLEKLPKILITYAAAAIIYGVFHGLMEGNWFQLDSLKTDIRYGGTLVDSGWFVIALIYDYLIFCLANAVTGKKWLVFLLLLAGEVLRVAFCVHMGYGIYWYNTGFGFCMGCLIGSYLDSVDRFVKRYFPWIIAGLFLLYVSVSKIQVPWNQSYLCMIYSVVMALLVIFLGRKISYDNPLFKRIGSCSLEIYLIHGLPKLFFRSGIVYIEDDVCYILLVIAATVVLAPLFQKLCSILCSWMIKKQRS